MSVRTGIAAFLAYGALTVVAAIYCCLDPVMRALGW